MSAPQTEVLVFVDGQEIARHILGPGAHIFGCAEACSIRFQADRVSPQHARLTVREDGSLLLEDLGSSTGTFLDGQTVRAPTPVARNQTIQIGAAQILVLQQALPTFEESTVAADGHGNGDTPPELSPSPRYELGLEIAQGGMGAVLAARQPSIRREVALKVMLRNVSAQDRLRFIEEAQITGQLEHPNIVPVHELAVNEQGQPYYTMKLVKGSTLKEILKLLANGDTATIAKYPLAALLTIFQKVCDAVAFAHAKGVIHRDLKPANIMVGDYGEVLLMDWGLAKTIGGRRSVAAPSPGIEVGADRAAPSSLVTIRDDRLENFATLDGAVMGTPQYMSPEQARGEVATLDQRSDIFSLGAILYELLTLLPPFPGKTTRDILAKIKSGHFDLPNARLRAADVPNPQHVPGGAIPDSLEAVISKALALDRDQRYQRVADLQADLTAYQGGFATAAENAGAWKQFQLLIKRHKALSSAVAASFLVISGITAVFTTRVVAERNRTAAQRDRARVGERAAVNERNRAEAERKIATEANAENLRHLHEASMADYAVAVQRIDKDGKWSEGVAHLARALDLDPTNERAAARLYSTLSLYGAEKQGWPRTVLRHEGSVYSAEFSPNGSRIVTASADKTARLWDAATGKPLGEPLRHEGAVLSAQFSPDGSRIVTASADKTARLWDAATGKPLGEPLRHEGAVLSAQFSPDGSRIVTASADKTARLWDAATGKPLGEPLHHEGAVLSAQFSPDGSRIVTVGSTDKTARLWDAATGKPLGEPLRHEGGVHSAQFSPDGSRVVTASYDKTARLWDAATGKPLGEPLRHEGGVHSAQFSPDSSRIVTASGYMARLWDAATGKPLGESLRHEGYVRSAQFSSDGSRIVTVSTDNNTARLWNVATGKPLGEPLRHEGSVHSVQFSPDGSRIVTASADRTARLWDAATDQPLGEPLRHEDGVRSAQFSPDGSRIVTVRHDKNTARLWDAVTGQPLGEPLHHEGFVVGAQFSPDGSRILTVSHDKTARLWDSATGKPLGEPLRHEGGVHSAHFSPDGSHIVTAIGGDLSKNTGEARVWDAATGKPWGEPLRHEGSVESAQFSPDGSRIVTASYDKTARLWDTVSTKALGEPLRHEREVYSAQFSPDGSRIVTASWDHTARLWDAVTGKPLGEPLRHEGVVDRAQFSPDGSHIVTVSIVDKTARLWDAATGKPLGEPLRHEGVVTNAQFSPDGSRIVTVSDDKAALLWDAATGQPLGEPLRHEVGVHSAYFSPDGSRILTASYGATARLWDAATGKPWGEPLRHEGSVESAQFSPDGSRIATASDDRTVRLWEAANLLHLPLPAPEWMRECTRAAAGFGFSQDGELQVIPGEQRLAVLQRPVAGEDAWAGLARWLAAPAAERTLTPESHFTRRQIAERERDFGSKESLESALRYDTTVPLARLLLAKFEANPQRAAFLREYDLKRLPDDAALWSRAAKALAEQHDPERARRALDKLATLDPDEAGTLKTELGL